MGRSVAVEHDEPRAVGEDRLALAAEQLRHVEPESSRQVPGVELLLRPHVDEGQQRIAREHPSGELARRDVVGAGLDALGPARRGRAGARAYIVATQHERREHDEAAHGD
jgi:hypothetical protein